MAQILLHGILKATILEAASLCNPLSDNGDSKAVRKTPTMSRRGLKRRLSWIKRVSFCRPKLFQQVGERVVKLYATVDLEKTRVARTRVVDEPTNPRWYESFHIYCAHHAANVVFTIKVDNPIGATLVGRAYLPVVEIVDGGEVDRWLEVEDRRPVGGGTSKVHVRVQYLDVARDPEQNWGKGVPPSPYYSGVPRCFFPQRNGCRLTLYQDAHVSRQTQKPVPRIALDGGQVYEPHRCWEDIFDAIRNARRLIYLTGWSVFAEITLVREAGEPYVRRTKGVGWSVEAAAATAAANDGAAITTSTLGELLKRKAREGVRVLMLVWDDRTSLGLGPLRKDGVMATHDQDTLSYFKGSSVHCILCPRNPDDADSYVQDLQISTLFTHHQKSLIVDGEVVAAPAPRSGRSSGSASNGTRRSLLSFVGGIDLCDGRYDTQHHSLFRTLGTTHRDDFHQPNFAGASIRKGGPREPWHDIHCRLEGPVAWDVLHNFEQRWRKQGGGDELLIQREQLAAELAQPYVQEEDAEAWRIQLFRSIDGGAVTGFPETPEDAVMAGLVSGKDHVIDRSIQDAYINAIRRAKDFIYIENQYFIGSSYAWRSQADGFRIEDVGALNLIPKELSLKVVSKIEAGERFAVYVVVPMWPEGVPESASVQAILDLQRRTMQMMYADITEAIRAKGLRARAEDYLNFYCLGNREVKTGYEYVPEERPPPDTDYSRAQWARRFMIYVHAKMMIVDDEYIIVGSANINQRSMDGARDTEIAMGAYQPAHLATGWNPAKGQVHGFRVSLWYEHLGMLDRVFLRPQSLECVKTVNQVATRNWALYASERLVEDLPGHLLRYPTQITDEGEITELPGVEFFPDTKARVLGTRSELLPPILTT